MKRLLSEKRIQIPAACLFVVLIAGAIPGIRFLHRNVAVVSELTESQRSEPLEPPASEAIEPETEVDRMAWAATFLQGPKSWKKRLEWSGKWGKTQMDGASFGGFGCGLCCMANLYCSFTDYRCSPVDMYDFAKEHTEYPGGGAIDWGEMKETLQACGFTCKVGKKPKSYEKFRELISKSLGTIVVVSSQNCDEYWKTTPGHYVTILAYDPDTEEIFLGDSGDPNHNRSWVPLDIIYRSLKTENRRQYLIVTDYTDESDIWKHQEIGGKCVLPDTWEH